MTTESIRTKTKRTALYYKTGAKKHGYYVRVVKRANGYEVKRRLQPFE